LDGESGTTTTEKYCERCYYEKEEKTNQEKLTKPDEVGSHTEDSKAHETGSSVHTKMNGAQEDVNQQQKANEL